MPLNLHIPLPGPFSYNKRIGGSSSPGLLTLLFMPVVWILMGTVWVLVVGSVLLWELCKYLYRLYRDWQSSRRSKHSR